jgi:hypothetical protein
MKLPVSDLLVAYRPEAEVLNAFQTSPKADITSRGEADSRTGDDVSSAYCSCSP